MSRKVFGVVLVGVAVASGLVYFLTRARWNGMVLTGIVTTNEIVVSSQVQGRIARMTVETGDSISKGQLLALIAPQELRANQAYYASAMKSTGAQVEVAEANLKFQELQTRDQIAQAKAALAAAEAQEKQAAANRDLARLSYRRTHALFQRGISSVQDDDQARATYLAAEAQVESLDQQVQAQQAALSLAKANAVQVAMRERQLIASEHQWAAARAQNQVAKVQLGYTQVRSPIAGLVSLRAALQGEVVTPGQPIVVVYDPNNLWVRADVEETYIPRIRLGEKFLVRFPGGFERMGTVFFRGVDAEYATQRDVSRTKRDIKTFEIRLRVNNQDRRLAPGLTAYVQVPFGG